MLDSAYDLLFYYVIYCTGSGETEMVRFYGQIECWQVTIFTCTISSLSVGYCPENAL